VLRFELVGGRWRPACRRLPWEARSASPADQVRADPDKADALAPMPQAATAALTGWIRHFVVTVLMPSNVATGRKSVSRTTTAPKSYPLN
jgi:hypothetical protein